MEILAKLHFPIVDDPEWEAKYISGLRCNVRYDENNYCCAVSHDIHPKIEQGGTHEVAICFLTHQPHVGKIKVGGYVELFSGECVFARGEVTLIDDVSNRP